jgi:hypothetical protein
VGVLDFLRGSGQGVRDKSEPAISKENRSYDELIDEIMKWNIDHTNILEGWRRKACDLVPCFGCGGQERTWFCVREGGGKSFLFCFS